MFMSPDYVRHGTCSKCLGKGRDRRNRKRKCAACDGTGQNRVTACCGQPECVCVLPIGAE